MESREGMHDILFIVCMQGEDRDRTDIVEWCMFFLSFVGTYFMFRYVTQSLVSRPQLKLVERRHGLRDSFNAVHALFVL